MSRFGIFSQAANSNQRCAFGFLYTLGYFYSANFERKRDNSIVENVITPKTGRFGSAI